MDGPSTSKTNDRDVPVVQDRPESAMKNRPSSRRGVRTGQTDTSTSRPVSRSSSVVSSQDGTNWRPASGIQRIQGTATRLASSSTTQQRGFSLSVATPIVGTQMNPTDRLITQQGLSSRPRSNATGLRGPGRRQILDKRYFEGVLQLKIRELGAEIGALRNETEKNYRDKEDLTIYDKQNKQLAKELTDLQGTLTDYNIVLDKLHTGTDIKIIEDEYQALKAINDTEQAKLEQLFAERAQKQQQIQQLEQDIEQERHAAERIVETMPPDMKEKYSEMSSKNENLQQTINQLQSEYDSLIREKSVLQQQIASSPLKQDAMRLELKILELEEKKNNLSAEENNNNPTNVQQKYMNQVRDDNAEIATIERSITKLVEEIKNCEKELEQINQDLEECQSERHKKYVELRKREETIETFLSSYDDTKSGELSRQSSLKSNIVKTMSGISKHLLTIPATANEYELVDRELGTIDVKSNVGERSLLIQYKQRELYFQKLQSLEIKLRNEINSLQERIDKMRSDLAVYSDVDKLKDDAEIKRTELLEKKQYFLEMKDTIADELKTTKQKYEKVQKELNDNETYKQWQALERKLAAIEKDNFALREYIADKTTEINYAPIKQRAIELVRVHNEALKKKYRSGFK